MCTASLYEEYHGRRVIRSSPRTSARNSLLKSFLVPLLNVARLESIIMSSSYGNVAKKRSELSGVGTSGPNHDGTSSHLHRYKL
eukprot:4483762-Amphidinium_carterae.1